MVYSLIQERGLVQYYDLRKKTSRSWVSQASPAVREFGERFAYLDDPEFLSLYCRPLSGSASTAGESGPGRSMQFYLEGVQCAACAFG